MCGSIHTLIVHSVDSSLCTMDLDRLQLRWWLFSTKKLLHANMFWSVSLNDIHFGNLVHVVPLMPKRTPIKTTNFRWSILCMLCELYSLYSCQEISNAIVISCTNRWNPFIIDYAHGHGNIIFNRMNTSTTLYKYPLCKCSNMFIIVLINCTCCLSVTSQLTPAYMWKALCHQVEIGKLLHLGTCSTKSFGCHQCKSEEFTFTFKLMMTEALSWSISKEFFNV